MIIYIILGIVCVIACVSIFFNIRLISILNQMKKVLNNSSNIIDELGKLTDAYINDINKFELNSRMKSGCLSIQNKRYVEEALLLYKHIEILKDFIRENVNDEKKINDLFGELLNDLYKVHEIIDSYEEELSEAANKIIDDDSITESLEAEQKLQERINNGEFSC